MIRPHRAAIHHLFPSRAAPARSYWTGTGFPQRGPWIPGRLCGASAAFAALQLLLPAYAACLLQPTRTDLARRSDKPIFRG